MLSVVCLAVLNHTAVLPCHTCTVLQLLSSLKGCAILQERNTVVLPLAKQPGTASSLATLHILKRFEFDASLMRSGVVVADKTARGDPLLVVRGAPSRIQALVTSGMLPPDFNQVRTCCCVSNISSEQVHTAGCNRHSFIFRSFVGSFIHSFIHASSHLTGVLLLGAIVATLQNSGMLLVIQS